jgi:hypothetical protein
VIVAINKKHNIANGKQIFGLALQLIMLAVIVLLHRHSGNPQSIRNNFKSSFYIINLRRLNSKHFLNFVKYIFEYYCDTAKSIKCV